MLRASALVALLAGSAAAAQEPAQEPAPGTRVEQWTRLRREKAERVEPPEKGFLERQLLALEKAERPSLFDLNVEGFYPRAVFLASGSEIAFGTRFWRPDLGGTRLDVHASAFFSFDGYEFYDLQLGRLPHREKGFPVRSTSGDDVYELGNLPRVDPGFAFYTSVRYRHYPQNRFYGLGGGTEPEDGSNFLNQDAHYEAVGGYKARRGLSASVRAGFVQAFIGPGTDDESPTIGALYDDTSAPGLDRQPDFFRLAGLVLLDGRDRPGNPHRGGMVAVGAARYDERGGDEFTFNRFAADARGYLALGSPQRVLAARAFALSDRPEDGSRVPFYFQEALGGSHTLRGFQSFRFRGEKVLLLQAEYRWEPWPALELALFADAGRAFRSDEAFSVEGLESDFGLGVRLKSSEDVLARFDVAKSREDLRFLLRFGPSF
jgi:surface antigen Omp85-like protein